MFAGLHASSERTSPPGAWKMTCGKIEFMLIYFGYDESESCGQGVERCRGPVFVGRTRGAGRPWPGSGRVGDAAARARSPTQKIASRKAQSLENA